MRAAAAFRRRRQEMQAEQATRLAEALPLPQLWLPHLFAAEIGLPEIDLLVDAMETGLVHLREPGRPRRLDGPTRAGDRWYPSARNCHCRRGLIVVNGLSALIRERRIIVCCGSGGVGKTTTAAALAVEGARQGRRTCVVTIDPARRLADALGLDSLTNTPARIDGAWRGELWALMLDTRSTFDAAVIRYARDEAQAQAIQASRLYRNLRDALSGTQEYMAVEKLYQLHQEGGFDLIVVDTPPTRRAMDFLSAPRHLTRLLDNPAIRMLGHAQPRLLAGRLLCRTGAAQGGSEDRWRGNVPRHRGLFAGFRGNGGRDPQPGQTSSRTVRRALDRLRAGRRTPSGCHRRGSVLRGTSPRVRHSRAGPRSSTASIPTSTRNLAQRRTSSPTMKFGLDPERRECPGIHQPQRQLGGATRRGRARRGLRHCPGRRAGTCPRSPSSPPRRRRPRPRRGADGGRSSIRNERLEATASSTPELPPSVAKGSRPQPSSHLSGPHVRTVQLGTSRPSDSPRQVTATGRRVLAKVGAD